MLNPIDIRTLDGTRLDVYPTATIEVNMGGLSLLNLQDRTTTYTNSFKLPRTKTNESVFAFASQPTRNNRPSVDVIITKGLFQRMGTLKVVDFDKDYSCSISYDLTKVELMKAYKYELLYHNKSVSASNDQTFVKNICETGYDGLFYLLTGNTEIPTETNKNGGLFVKIRTLIDNFCTANGLTFSSLTFLGDVDFNNMYVSLPNLYIEGASSTVYKTNAIGDIVTTKTMADILKRVCLLFFAEYKFFGNILQIDTVETLINYYGPIHLEGFSNVKKIIYSGLGAENKISYNFKEEGLYPASLTDTVIGDGDDVKQMFDLLLSVPETNEFGFYIKSDANTFTFMAAETTIEQVKFKGIPYTQGIAAVKEAAPLSLSGFYSSILNPIFANPVILEATRNIDPITADKIMTQRVINSVQLGGRYWVDSMAYNLTTGQSKLTLIKLP